VGLCEGLCVEVCVTGLAVMVMVTLASFVTPATSVTVSWKVRAADDAAAGATKLGRTVLAPVSATGRPAVCAHA
jgi:hypothetical protein